MGCIGVAEKSSRNASKKQFRVHNLVIIITVNQVITANLHELVR